MLVALFDATVGAGTEVPEYDMRCCMCRVGKVDFELMEPTGSTGVVADLLARRGEGLHHVAFAVDDVAATINYLQSRSVRFVGEHPITKTLPCVDFAGRPFCEELQFTFSHPASILGILLEFIQYPKKYATP
jgi:methylmalonyl-CoA/ethylmalonyl-CoA epimerase